MKLIPNGDVDSQSGVYKGARRDGERTANLSCPNCGRVASLSDHAIHTDGTVNPSVVCPYGCGFHEYIRLDKWNPN